jgi:transposase
LVVSRSVGRAIGLDVHRDFCEVAICEAGRVRSAGRIKTSLEVLELFAQSLGREDRVALEVTGAAWEIARILEGHVRRVVVVSPDDTGIRQARAKTDRLDARTLARLLAAGELDAVWMPDDGCRVMRRRLARREQLVRSRSRAKNEIHAVLMRRLQGRPPVSDLFGVKGRKWLSELELPVEESGTIESALRHVEFLDGEIAAVERLIARAALGSQDARRLVDRARRERDLRRDVFGRGRRHPPLPHVRGARRVPRSGSARAPVRQRTGEGRPDPPSAARARRAGCWSRRPGR